MVKEHYYYRYLIKLILFLLFRIKIFFLFSYASRGKFSQRSDLPRTSIVSCGNKFRELVNNPSVETSAIHFVNDDMCIVNWNNTNSDELPTAAFSSIAIAAHVTAQARLHLYSFMEQLGDRVLYCDTDSVFFTEGPNDPKIEQGDFLGQMTDELDAWPGSHISEFVCGECIR